MISIKDLRPYEILDSRGTPTIALELLLSNGASVSASIPSGASTGLYEACELRDDDPKRYGGKGVLKALSHLKGEIKDLLVGTDPCEQKKIDQSLIELDGTPTKSRLGANAILAASLACAKANSLITKTPLFESLIQTKPPCLPSPMVNIINGGQHANNGLDFQEFMIKPLKKQPFAQALRQCVEVFNKLKYLLQNKGYSTAVGDEGGFAPALSSHEKALDLLLMACEQAGYRPGEDITFCLDCAASEFYDSKLGLYLGKNKDKHSGLNNQEMLSSLKDLCRQYPISSIEDPLDQEDWQGWQALTSALGSEIQIVGDDLLVTNLEFLTKAIEKKAANAILLKPNQVGTLTETLQTLSLAQSKCWNSIISHRSGETEDSFIADLAVGTAAGQIKTGSVSRSDRNAKYNRLLYIEEYYFKN